MLKKRPELLPFARACSTADQLATRLRDTATWRREWARTEEDWSFDTFFTSRRDAFYRDIDLEGEMMEWLGGESEPAVYDERRRVFIDFEDQRGTSSGRSRRRTGYG